MAGTDAGSAAEVGLTLPPVAVDRRLFDSGIRRSSCLSWCFPREIGMPAGLLTIGEGALTGGGKPGRPILLIKVSA